MSQPVLCLRSLALQIRFFDFIVCVCVYMSAMPMEIRKECEIPRHLWVLETKLESPPRAE